MREYKHRVAAEVGAPGPGPQYDRHTGIYFFLSLDLVNSTAYKAKNRDWKYRIRMFYDEAKDFWRNRKTSLRPSVWKHAGDEVLFHAKVDSVRELEDAVESSYQAMRTVCRTVQTWTQGSSPSLFVKATCWAAYAEYHKPSPESELPSDDSLEHRNIVFQSPSGSGEGASMFDFLGPEIDAGFRIASGSIKNALVVSAELAELLWSRGARCRGDRLRVVDYRELKGVWDGRHYPIVWYRDDWSAAAFGGEYEYDDRFKFDVLQKAHTANAETMQVLRSVLEQVKKTWLQDVDLPADRPANADDEQAVLIAPAMEVHAVAICFRDDGRVLVARRPKSKEVSPSSWEAGCAQLRPGDNFQSAMKREYRADFGLELTFSDLANRAPVGSYAFTKRGRQVPGVIFVATATNADALQASKHDEARWEDPDALSAEIKANCVPDLVETVARAYRVWRSGREEPA